MVEVVTMNESYLKPFLEGMILIAFAILALTFVKAEPANYMLNYNIYPETNELTLQQGSDYTLYVNYELLSNKDFSFTFNTYSPEGIFVNVLSRKTAFNDFTLPLYFHVGSLAPGKYPVELSSKVLYGGIINERRTTFYVNVVPKSKVLFKTSSYTNELPKLELIDISTRNILLDANNSQTVLLQFRNTGSHAKFILQNIIDSEDKNKVHVSFNEQYFQLEKNEIRNIIMTISLDSNYAILYTPIYLYAIEEASKQQFDLSQINITLKTQNILYAYSKETNMFELTNIGTDMLSLDINTSKRELSAILLPNQTYRFTPDVNDGYAIVFVNGKEYQKVEFANNDVNSDLKDKKNLPNIGSSVAGFFSLGSGAIGWIIFVAAIVLVLLIIYKLFFARKAVFANHIYVKDLKLVNNKDAH